jgi:thiosulfate dehydrogenase
MRSWLLVVVMGCGSATMDPPKSAETPPPASAPTAEKGANKDDHLVTGHAEGKMWVGWEPPPESAIPEGPYGDAIREGLDLFNHTNERLPDYVNANFNCASCHLEAGRKDNAAKLAGVAARFPKFMPRTGAVIPLQDRVNYCFTRSLAGNRLPTDSKEMVSMVAYLTWLSSGVPVGMSIPNTDLPTLEMRTPDLANGEKLFTDKQCVTCHGADGAGVGGAFPALWGEDSWSVGASMTRLERAASFIKLFMPKTAPGTLSEQEAFDLAAFINSHPRPDAPNKEQDFPTGGAPKDTPYPTFGRDDAPRSPVLPRSTPDRSIVPMPTPVAEMTR